MEFGNWGGGSCPWSLGFWGAGGVTVEVLPVLPNIRAGWGSWERRGGGGGGGEVYGSELFRA